MTTMEQLVQIRGLLSDGKRDNLDLQNTKQQLVEADRIYGEKIKEYGILTEKLQSQLEVCQTAHNAPETPQDETTLPPGQTFQLAPILQAIIDALKKWFR